MIDANLFGACSGCGACANACPKDAIAMKPDESGFLFPKIDQEKCIQCDLCNAVCQIDHSFEKSDKRDRRFYALVNNNQTHLKVSSSGGAFLAAAEYVFGLNGVVAGCAFDENLKAHHIITHDLPECIEKLCGSKYVQSDTQNVYSQVKEYLSEGRTVLFVGTPCQVEALYLFLKRKPDNLITMDLICHGVSSPLLWKKHKDYLESKVGSKINRYRFRGKEKVGWALYYYYHYGNKNKCKQGPSLLDRYYTDFLKGVNYRESCYQCRYANPERAGDITIGDFWGAEKFTDGFDLKKGVSLIVVNSQKGNDLLRSISEKITLKEVSESNAVADNQNLVKPTGRPSERDAYYRHCYGDFEKWEKEYIETKAWKIAKLKSKVPSFIKKLLRR